MTVRKIKQDKEVSRLARAAILDSTDPTMHRVMRRERILTRIAAVLAVCVIVMCAGSLVVAWAALATRQDTANRATNRINYLNSQIAILNALAQQNSARIADMQATIDVLVKQLKGVGVEPLVGTERQTADGIGTATSTTTTTTTTTVPKRPSTPPTTQPPNNPPPSSPPPTQPSNPPPSTPPTTIPPTTIPALPQPPMRVCVPLTNVCVG